MKWFLLFLLVAMFALLATVLIIEIFLVPLPPGWRWVSTSRA